MIALIDYGRGNLLSVKNAIELTGAQVKICKTPQDLLSCEKIILPGVGAFREGIKALRERGLEEVIVTAVKKKKIPILGICLGMQLLATKGYEPEETSGLGLIDAEVKKMELDDKDLKIPQIGWNQIQIHGANKLFDQIPSPCDFYFVHSYAMSCRTLTEVAASFEYGGRFTAAVLKENIFGTQFHPEKSQDFGLRLLENFVRWIPEC